MDLFVYNFFFTKNFMNNILILCHELSFFPYTTSHCLVPMFINEW